MFLCSHQPSLLKSKQASHRNRCHEAVRPVALVPPHLSDYHRLMSDYEVNLVNDNLQEFYVRFYGPTESEPGRRSIVSFVLTRCSTLRRRRLEDPRRAPRSVSVQVAQHRLYEQDLPSQHRRTVRLITHCATHNSLLISRFPAAVPSV